MENVAVFPLLLYWVRFLSLSSGIFSFVSWCLHGRFLLACFLFIQGGIVKSSVAISY